MTNDDSPHFEERITVRSGMEDAEYVLARGLKRGRAIWWLIGLITGAGLGLILG